MRETAFLGLAPAAENPRAVLHAGCPLACCYRALCFFCPPPPKHTHLPEAIWNFPSRARCIPVSHP